MEFDTYEGAIARAKARLEIMDSEFAKLTDEQSALVVNQIEEKFVDGHNWYWWWEHLHQVDFAAFHAQDAAFEGLCQILPGAEAFVWFVVEPLGEEKRFSLYEARAKHIQPVLGESPFFEYYLAAKDLSWLVGENHHGYFFCVGEPVTTRLKAIVEQNPEQWKEAPRSD